MKNKSKIKKIKHSSSTKNEWPKEWLYLNEHSLSIRDLYNALIENNDFQVEIWEDAGILEIVFQDDYSIDMELADETSFTEDRFLALLNDQPVKTAYLVTIATSNTTVVKEALQKITSKYEGVFCSDDESLNLIIK